MYLYVRKISNRREQSLTGSSIRYDRSSAATCRFKRLYTYGVYIISVCWRICREHIELALFNYLPSNDYISVLLVKEDCNSSTIGAKLNQIIYYCPDRVRVRVNVIGFRGHSALLHTKHTNQYNGRSAITEGSSSTNKEMALFQPTYSFLTSAGVGVVPHVMVICDEFPQSLMLILW